VHKAAEFQPALEALRGLASLAVVLVHCTLCWSVLVRDEPGAGLVSDLLLIVLSTDAPVTLFFVLSGYVLTGALCRLGDVTPGSLTVYAARRLLRIVPAAWVALFATIAVVAACSSWPRSFEGTDYWIADYLESSRIENLGGSLFFVDDLINPTYWSLQVELVGSALMPALYASMRGSKPTVKLAAWVALLALLPLVPYRSGLSHLSSTFAFCFSLGTLTFHILTGHARLAARLFSPALGIAAAALLVLAHALLGPSAVFDPLLGNSEWLSPILGDGPNIDLYLRHLVEAAASAALVGVIVVNPGRCPVLWSPTSRFLGRISYSLYVIHFAVIFGSVVLLRATVTAWPWLAPIATAGLVLPVSIIAAWLLHVSAEKPTMALGRRVARDRRSGPAQELHSIKGKTRWGRSF